MRPLLIGGWEEDACRMSVRHRRRRLASILDAPIDGTGDVIANRSVVDLEESRRAKRCRECQRDDPTDRGCTHPVLDAGRGRVIHGSNLAR
jgi:hypothetical protein